MISPNKIVTPIIEIQRIRKEISSLTCHIKISRAFVIVRKNSITTSSADLDKLSQYTFFAERRNPTRQGAILCQIRVPRNSKTAISLFSSKRITSDKITNGGILTLVLTLIIVLLDIVVLYFLGFTSPAASWLVAIGTISLALATFASLKHSISEDAKRRKEEDEKKRRNLALKRVEEFYSPLKRIFTANPESVRDDAIIKQRANEVVAILLGKAYRAKKDTMLKIGKLDVEHIAYFNWTNPKIGYLGFKDKNEMQAWCEFLEIAWKDYDSLVQEYYDDTSPQVKRMWGLRIQCPECHESPLQPKSEKHPESRVFECCNDECKKVFRWENCNSDPKLIVGTS